MTVETDLRRVLKSLTKVHARITKHNNGLGISISWVFRGSPKNATTKAALLDLALKSVACPWRWMRTDYEPALRNHSKGNGVVVQRMTQTSKTTLLGSSYAADWLRRTIHGAGPKRDGLLIEASEIVRAVRILEEQKADALDRAKYQRGGDAIEAADKPAESEPLVCPAEVPATEQAPSLTTAAVSDTNGQ